jgi:hypothetical protein
VNLHRSLIEGFIKLSIELLFPPFLHELLSNFGTQVHVFAHIYIYIYIYIGYLVIEVTKERQ